MNLLDHTPNFSLSDACNLAHDLFGLDATASVLPSERDQNFMLVTPDAMFILKIANALEDRDFLDAQQQILSHLAAAGIDYCPQMVPARNGNSINKITSETGDEHAVYLMTYLMGFPLATVMHQSDDLLADLGHKLGRMDAASATFNHPAAHRTFHWDLAQGFDVVTQYRDRIPDPEVRKMVDQLLTGSVRDAQPLLSTLRKSIIHGDANNYNVLVGGDDDIFETDIYRRNRAVSGIVDFGDMVHSYTVGNVAIGAAYAMLGKSDPMAAAAEVVRGYHAANPLTDDEFAVLFGLITLRLCVSVCMAEVQRAGRPGNPYFDISQEPIRMLLPQLCALSYPLATAYFRHACGLDPTIGAESLSAWLGSERFAPILGHDLARAETITLDLSVGSPLLHGEPARNDEQRLTSMIFDQMRAHDAAVAIGRYNEPRLIYTDPIFRLGSGPLDERRTIHIGLDLFADAGTPVYAPLDGTVHVATVNDRPQDYGGFIVLAHETPAGTPFYTLYGHLSHASIAAHKVGERIRAGQEIARFGEPDENGGWTPHLHFQIISDMLKLDADFPGVVPPSRREFWCALCPDPNLIVGIPEERTPAAEAGYARTLSQRKQRVGRNMSIGYRNHLKIERGWRQYLWDHQGDKFLDAYNNVPHVGHCHPHVVEAGRRQMGVLNTNTRYLHDALNQYAERLAATMPDPLNVCFFLNSASEANELALRLARAYTGATDMIVNEGAYHGHTTGLIDISPYKHDGPGGRGAPRWVHSAPIADLYRGRFKADDPEAAQKYADQVQAIIERLEVDHTKLAGFIAETCPSVGGQIILPPGYLATVYAYVRAAGGVAIADEVQTGYGRTGSHFYAFEAQQVIPDIVVLGKPIGNGHPIGALVTTREIADAFDNGMEFFSTFGGNTVSCAIGMAVLDVLEAERLQAHADRVGQKLLMELRTFADRHPLVGDVRGAGLFLGIELVRDRETLLPAADEAAFVVNQLRERHILVGTDGPLHNVIKIRPPMPFDENDAGLLLTALDDILASFSTPNSFTDEFLRSRDH